jgi:hypothetical protein
MTKYTVQYYAKVSNMLKFVDIKEKYKVSDELKDSVKLKKGDVVNAEIEDNIVVKLEKVEVEETEVKEEQPKKEKEEVKTEEKKEEDKIEIVEKYIHAVARPKEDGRIEVVKFTADTPWVHIAPEFQFGCMEKGLVARNTCELKMVNGMIADVISVKEATPKEEKQATTKAKSDNVYRSPEDFAKETALNCSKDIVVALINSGKIDVTNKEVVQNAYSDLADVGYNFLTK